MMFKTGSAQERLDQAENWSGRATLIILAGIALEILVVLGWIYKSPHWDKWFTIIANALIGLGLVLSISAYERQFVPLGN